MSSRRDVRAFLWEVVDAADSILRFTEGVGEAAFIESGLIQAAVERKFIIIGEALNATAKLDPELADEIPDIARIIGFRNLLVHGYFEVDNRRVYDLIVRDLPDLRSIVARLLIALDT